MDCRSDFVTADVAGAVGVGIEIGEIMLERSRRYWTRGAVVPPPAQDLEPSGALLEVLP
jgi:hypothetical protein